MKPVRKRHIRDATQRNMFDWMLGRVRRGDWRLFAGQDLRSRVFWAGFNSDGAPSPYEPGSGLDVCYLAGQSLRTKKESWMPELEFLMKRRNVPLRSTWRR